MIAIQLPAELQEFVEQAVKSGRFPDDKALICEALETLRTREEFHQFQVSKLQQELAAGVRDLEAGQLEKWDGEEIKRKGRTLLAARLTGA